MKSIAIFLYILLPIFLFPIPASSQCGNYQNNIISSFYDNCDGTFSMKATAIRAIKTDDYYNYYTVTLFKNGQSLQTVQTSLKTYTFKITQPGNYKIVIKYNLWQASGFSGCYNYYEDISDTKKIGHITDFMVINSGNNMEYYEWKGNTWINHGQVGANWTSFTHYFANDFTGDGISDLMVRHNNGSILFYEWTGSAWISHGAVGWNWTFTHYFAADFTGDGITDLMVRNSSGTLFLYEWTGNSWIQHGAVGWNWTFSDYFAADFTGDGIADLMVLNPSGNMLLYKWTGSSWVSMGQIGSGFNFTHYFIDDYTGDGKSDIMARNSNGNLFLYQCTGSALVSLGQVGSGWNFTNYFTGDFDGDGIGDMMVRQSNGNILNYQWNGSAWTNLGVVATNWNFSIYLPANFSICNQDKKLQLADISEPHVPGNLSVFPNPFEHTIYFGYPASQISEINIINTQGEKIWSQNRTLSMDNVSIDLSHLSAGIYYYIVKTAEGTFNGKIIKK